MIVGIAGTFAAGKDVAAEYLAETKSFYWVSTGDMVRQRSKQLHGSIERSLLKQVADEARREFGSSYFVEQALKTFRSQQEEYQGVVITGLRAVGEAEAIQKEGGKLVFVDAPQKLRYERSQKRGRDDQEESFAEFQENEDQELYPKEQNEWVINISALKNMADVYLINDTDLGSFLAQIDVRLFGR